LLPAQDEAIAEANRGLTDRDATIAALQEKGKAAEVRIAALVLQAKTLPYLQSVFYTMRHCASQQPKTHSSIQPNPTGPTLDLILCRAAFIPKLGPLCLDRSSSQRAHRAGGHDD
jgi:hypothetical protein